MLRNCVTYWHLNLPSPPSLFDPPCLPARHMGSPCLPARHTSSMLSASAISQPFLPHSNLDVHLPSMSSMTPSDPLFHACLALTTHVSRISTPFGPDATPFQCPLGPSSSISPPPPHPHLIVNTRSAPTTSLYTNPTWPSTFANCVNAACRTCGAGQYLSAACTQRANGVCSSCPANTYRSQSGHRYTSCQRTRLPPCLTKSSLPVVFSIYVSGCHCCLCPPCIVSNHYDPLLGPTQPARREHTRKGLATLPVCVSV